MSLAILPALQEVATTDVNYLPAGHSTTLDNYSRSMVLFAAAISNAGIIHDQTEVLDRPGPPRPVLDLT